MEQGCVNSPDMPSLGLHVGNPGTDEPLRAHECHADQIVGVLQTSSPCPGRKHSNGHISIGNSNRAYNFISAAENYESVQMRL